MDCDKTRNPASVRFRTIHNIIHANLELFTFIWAKKTELNSDNDENTLFCCYEAANERWNLKRDPERNL
jgi:hypothetical protein